MVATPQWIANARNVKVSKEQPSFTPHASDLPRGSMSPLSESFRLQRKKSLSHTFNPTETKAPFEWPAPSIPRSSKLTKAAILEATTIKLDDDEKDEIDYLQLILNARVYDVCIESPLHFAKRLSKKMGNAIYFKREDLQQPLFSFKLRGAFNRMYVSLEGPKCG